jgi:hypothetical protein
VLDLVAQVPTPVWGRDELGTAEMWNSKSVIAASRLSRSGPRPGGARGRSAHERCRDAVK